MRHHTDVLVPASLAGLRLGTSRAMARVLTDPSQPWARAAQEQWGMCGLRLAGDPPGEEPAVGLVSPGLQVPSGHPLQQWSKAPGGAHLLAVQLPDESDEDPEALTRLLVQHLVRRLHGQVDTLEAVASTGSWSPGAALDCTRPPMGWLEAAGFGVVDEHRCHASVRMQLEVGQAVRWHPDLNRAWELLAGLVPRPVRAPEPTGRQGSRRSR